MGAKMKAPVIRRQVEVCPFCGTWDPFRKANGRSTIDHRTGLRRIYGECKACRKALVVQYVPPEVENDEIEMAAHQENRFFQKVFPNGEIKSA
mgnify:CR=1 FL=1